MRRTLLLTLLLALCAPAAAQVYEWTDAEGNRHFGDRPPGDGARSVDVAPAPRPSGSAPPQRREGVDRDRLIRALEAERLEREEARQQAERVRAERQRNCVVARDNLRSYLSAGTLYDLDDRGNRRTLNEAERARAEAQARAEVARWCD
jgi:hypothetical protein